MKPPHEMSSEDLAINQFWTARKLGPRNYVAKRAAAPGWPEQIRFYFTRDALEHDFGRVKFPCEEATQ